jgi:hypothetical protein
MFRYGSHFLPITMIRAYQYLFYRLYCWQSRQGRTDFVAAFCRFVCVIVVVCWNILFLFEIVELMFGVRIAWLRSASTFEIAIAATLLAIPQYFFLMFNGRYRNIAEKFSAESPTQHRSRGFLVFLYVACSFLLLVIGSVFRGTVL